MRVVQVLHGWPPESMGGTGQYVSSLSAGLRARGCTVWLAHPSPAPGPVGIHSQGDSVSLTGPRPARWSSSWRRPRELSAWRRWLRATSPDVVHIHHLSGLPLGLPAASRSLGVPVVLTLHDYALPCARGQLIDRDLSLCPGPTATRCSTCLSDQLRLTPLTAYLSGILSRWPSLRRRAHAAGGALPPRAVDRARVQARLDVVSSSLASVDVLLSPSHDLAARFASLGYRRPRWCPLPLTQPVPAAPPAPPGPVRFLFAGSVIPTKGPHHLLSAFSRLPAGRATLTIAGHSPDFGLWPGFGESLRARAEATPGVTWLGGIPSSKIPALLHSHDVLVLASLWPENSPLTIREATAAGLPVITTTLGGARELASDARLVAPGDIPALVSALEACCAQGRHRTRPHRWQTSDEHAIWMLDEVYRGVVSQ